MLHKILEDLATHIITGKIKLQTCFILMSLVAESHGAIEITSADVRLYYRNQDIDTIKF